MGSRAAQRKIMLIRIRTVIEVAGFSGQKYRDSIT